MERRKNPIKFSVLLSVYEKENADYVREALESIIHQTRKPNQIVMVKDGKLTEKLNDVIELYLRKIS